MRAECEQKSISRVRTMILRKETGMMKYVLRMLMRVDSHRHERKRQALRQRLITMFQMDALEGQLDCLVSSTMR